MSISQLRETSFNQTINKLIGRKKCSKAIGPLRARTVPRDFSYYNKRQMREQFFVHFGAGEFWKKHRFGELDKPRFDYRFTALSIRVSNVINKEYLSIIDCLSNLHDDDDKPMMQFCEHKSLSKSVISWTFHFCFQLGKPNFRLDPCASVTVFRTPLSLVIHGEFG